MENKKSTISFIGIAFGAVALLLAIIHFSAGPFTPQPSIEEYISDKAVSFKEAAVAKLKGEQAPTRVEAPPAFDADRILNLAAAVLGGIALILAVVAFAANEPPKAAVGAAILGAGALAFQFAIIALGAIVVFLLYAAVLRDKGAG